MSDRTRRQPQTAQKPKAATKPKATTPKASKGSTRKGLRHPNGGLKLDQKKFGTSASDQENHVNVPDEMMQELMGNDFVKSYYA